MKKLLFYLIISIGFINYTNAQTVSGVVTDSEDGQPLPGVNIQVKGSTSGTITNMEGQYSLDVSGENPILVFSFIGYEGQEIEVKGQTLINVQLKVETTGLDEVVVVGYGVKKKALVTGANLNVKGDEITELKTGSTMEALQGIAAGVSVLRNSGAPGAGTKVKIRGAGTIYNADPLYIVDGVAVGNIDYLNPSDIESIDVLKDAASAAIYGARAANGVVLVTTKKGKKGSPVTVSYDFYYGYQNIYKTLPVLNAQEYMFIMDESRTNIGLEPFDWENMIVNGNTFLDANFQGNIGQLYGQQVWDKLQSGWKGTNWIEEMSSKDAPVQSHSVNITGGQENFVYSLGFSYYDQASILGKDITDAGYKRMTVRLNTEMVLFKNTNRNIVTLGQNLVYTNSENRYIATGNIYYNDLHNALVTNPLMPVMWNHPDLDPWTNGYAPTLEGVSVGQHNPIAVMYYRHNFRWEKSNDIKGNAYVVIEPIKNLKFRSAFGIDGWFGNGRSWSPVYKLAERYQNRVDAAEQSMYRGVNYTFTNTVSYDFTVGTDHKINVLAGTEMLKNVLNTDVGGSKQNTLFGDPEYAYLENTQNPTSTNEINTWGRDWAAQGGGLMSYFGRVSYNFKEKYLFDAVFRVDGSSGFTKDNRWGYFPSFSAGWVFSEEDFMKGFDWLSFAKLRASWGQNGNNQIGRSFVYNSNIAYLNQGYYFGPNKAVPNIAAVPANVPNPDIGWETSEQLNFGLDATFLNSRLGFNIDWYKKTTKDWIVKAPIQGTYGADAPWINGGDIENKGVEIVLSWNDKIGDFKYGITASGTYNENEVTRIANAEGIIYGPSHVLSQGTSDVFRIEEGRPVGYFIGYVTDGIFQNQAEVDAYVTADGTPIVIGGEEGIPRQPGDVRFRDIDGNGIINDDDRVYIGNPNPDFELGIQLNAEYKGIYINTTLTGKFGMQVMQSYRSFADQLTQNYTTDIFGRWHGEGTSNKLPRLTYATNANTNNISDIYMHDADYLRINNITLGYRFDHLLKDINWIKSASVYVAFNNLYTFTKYNGMDPEVGYGPTDDDNPDNDYPWASGIDLGLYPLPRTFLFGVNVTF